jgi:hypothetical protein
VTVREYGLLFWTVVGVVTLLVASPVLSRVLVYPRTEFFTELWLLDANGETEAYPFNVTTGEAYTVRLGIGNQLGTCAYYMIQVKVRNGSQSAPTSFGPIDERVPSSVPSLATVRACVADEGQWEAPVTFSFAYALNATRMHVAVTRFTWNEVDVEIEDQIIGWDDGMREFRGFLMFELWRYEAAVGGFQYHGRFVSLRLNMTA